MSNPKGKYALKVRDINSSFSLYVNGKLIEARGNVSKVKKWIGLACFRRL